ncbi:uncharacterized protein H6S33_009060 [Morchella sextelata]|uniref:uncharacterized protein n=1 Tax=Morchella sextelata TaxID=1174677 RepID=UPI001D0591DF|nr:uncharacterized protein H6S33_009060 [Morchella sextelata]KAH0612680.1 hypothetical protein H6S33_009060 [Morchella sextelata]
MAPAVTIATSDNVPVGDYKEISHGPKAFNKDVEIKGADGHAPAAYPHYLPTWVGDKSYPPLKPFEHTEHALSADPAFPNLLPTHVELAHLSPKFGTEVRGIQLSSLTNAGKDELALFVAQRGVVAFRDQDFANLPIEKALEFGGYFGRHHIHPSSGQPKGYPEIHLVHRGAGEAVEASVLESRTSSVAWHSDVTYEVQPPGTTFLYALDIPKTNGGYSGGDTAFVSQVEAYNRLSEPFKQRLEGLTAIHSGHEQADLARRKGGVVRREPVANEHPIVRTHPATGKKALFINPQFTRHIVGFKKEESDALLKFLYDHIAYGLDFQIRVKWEPKTVVVWDNRVTAHSALLDWDDGGRRHLARITPQAERPF